MKMTSGLGNIASPDPPSSAAGTESIRARRPAGRGRRIFARPVRGGFTLLEIVLVLSLLVLLAGLTLTSYLGTLESLRISEHATRMAALLRAARAEAAITGRRFRLSFDPETTQPIVAFEPDALAEPGTFVPYNVWWVKQARLEEGIRVLECRRTGASDFVEAGADTPSAREDEAELAEVTFYPDGSSDSVRIVLTSDDEDRPWYAEVTLNGVDGTIHTREFDPEAEDEEPIEEPAEPSETAGRAGR